MKYVFLGLSITSSWGNGHATTYRCLVQELAARGHSVTFLERDVPWYREHRDLTSLLGARIVLYRSVDDLMRRHDLRVRHADAVIVGSYVPDGIAVAEWVTRVAQGVTAFYDIDTPVTLAGLTGGESSYLKRSLVPRFDLYLSFTGGPTLVRLEREFGARAARALYCSVDPTRYFPREMEPRWGLGYLGTYSADRQPALEQLLLKPARASRSERFVVAGAMYPEELPWPENVERVSHVSPREHAGFFSQQRFTLNVTRAAMIAAGYSPSVRLFEAAATGTPIISDVWEGIEELFVPGQEILLARTAEDVLQYLHHIPEHERLTLAARARAKILAAHTAAHRAGELDQYVAEIRGQNGTESGKERVHA